MISALFILVVSLNLFRVVCVCVSLKLGRRISWIDVQFLPRLPISSLYSAVYFLKVIGKFVCNGKQSFRFKVASIIKKENEAGPKAQDSSLPPPQIKQN